MQYTEEGKLTDEDLRYDRRYVWTCAIGGIEPVVVPRGGDAPMRRAVEEAFYQRTGERAAACFSGWGEKFTEVAVAVIEDRAPNLPKPPKPNKFVGLFVFVALMIGFGVGLSL